MNSLIAFEFESQVVRFVDGKPVANDVAAVLGYSNPAKTISTKVFPENKEVAKLQTPAGVQSAMVLKESGVLQLVSSSRLPNAINIAKKLGLWVVHCKHEQESIRILESAFADLQPIPQFQVHGYRIDLYLAKANIAIECDENDHNWTQYVNDSKRENLIKSALGCSFVRYNPSKLDFNVGEVILKIRGMI